MFADFRRVLLVGMLHSHGTNGMDTHSAGDRFSRCVSVESELAELAVLPELAGFRMMAVLVKLETKYHQQPAQESAREAKANKIIS